MVYYHTLNLKEWTTPDFRNTPSTTNLEGEETVDAPGSDGNASMPEQVKRPVPWRKMMMMVMMTLICSYKGPPPSYLATFPVVVTVYIFHFLNIQ
jgi:hypothetical protein